MFKQIIVFAALTLTTNQALAANPAAKQALDSCSDLTDSMIQCMAEEPVVDCNDRAESFFAACMDLTYGLEK